MDESSQSDGLQSAQGHQRRLDDSRRCGHSYLHWLEREYGIYTASVGQQPRRRFRARVDKRHYIGWDGSNEYANEYATANKYADQYATANKYATANEYATANKYANKYATANEYATANKYADQYATANKYADQRARRADGLADQRHHADGDHLKLDEIYWSDGLQSPSQQRSSHYAGRCLDAHLRQPQRWDELYAEGHRHQRRR